MGSWGIRGPNWFQLSFASNDQSCSIALGALGFVSHRCSFRIAWPWLQPPSNIEHMSLPVPLNISVQYECVKKGGRLFIQRRVACLWLDTALGVPFCLKERASLAGTNLVVTLQALQFRAAGEPGPGWLCGTALICRCGGDKTSDSLIDGLADITIPCESTEGQCLVLV